MSHTRQLPVPPAAESDLKAIELARIWAAGGKQHVSLATGLWDDPGNWGIMLVDLARHVAAAYQELEGRNPNYVLEQIKESFEAEWSVATDHPHGGLMK